MAGGKNNTTRIEDLEELTRNLVSRLNVHDETLKWLSEILRKGAESTEEHGKKIVVFDEKIVVLADFRRCLDTVSAIQQDLVAFRKDTGELAEVERRSEEGKGRDDAALVVVRTECRRSNRQRHPDGSRRIRGGQAQPAVTVSS